MNSGAGRRPPDLLRLARRRFESSSEVDGDLIVKTTAIRNALPPPCCLAMIRRKMGTKTLHFRDFPIQGQSVKLEVRRQRWSCRSCGTITYERLPEMDDEFRMTRRFRSHIEVLAVRLPFTEAATQAGVDERMVRRIFTAHADEVFGSYEVILPRVVGMDEIHIQGAPRFVISDVEQGLMLDMRMTRHNDDLWPYLAGLRGRGEVEVVCQDMWSGYRKLTRELFPRAQTVIDKYHVQRTANYGMELVRRHLYLDIGNKERVRLKRKRALFMVRRYGTGASATQLERLFTEYPRLKLAYDVKERFYEIYDAEDRADAERRTDRWLADCPPEMHRFFKQSISAFQNWRPHILRYFEHRYTSAYVERLNGLIRKMNVSGAGYGFEVLRRKAILKHGIHASTQRGRSDLIVPYQPINPL